MRNSLKRPLSAETKPTLRDRLAATKLKAVNAFRRRAPGAGAARAPSLDPIFDAISETRRLHEARDVALSLPQLAGNIDPPEQNEAVEAFFHHVNDVLLQTVPTTVDGCAALARYAVEFVEANGWALDAGDDDNQHLRVLGLIARSPLL